MNIHRYITSSLWPAVCSGARFAFIRACWLAEESEKPRTDLVHVTAPSLARLPKHAEEAQAKSPLAACRATLIATPKPCIMCLLL